MNQDAKFLRCTIHKVRNVEDQLKKSGTPPSDIAKARSIIFGYRRVDDDGTPVLVLGIIGSETEEIFRERVEAAPLKDKVKKYLLADAKNLVEHYSHKRMKEAGIAEYIIGSTNPLESLNNVLKLRIREEVKLKNPIDIHPGLIAKVVSERMSLDLVDFYSSFKEGGEFRNEFPGSDFLTLSFKEQQMMTEDEVRHWEKRVLIWTGSGEDIGMGVCTEEEFNKWNEEEGEREHFEEESLKRCQRAKRFVNNRQMFPGTRRTGHKKEKKQKLAIFKQGPVREELHHALRKKSTKTAAFIGPLNPRNGSSALTSGPTTSQDLLIATGDGSPLLLPPNTEITPSRSDLVELVDLVGEPDEYISRVRCSGENAAQTSCQDLRRPRSPITPSSKPQTSGAMSGADTTTTKLDQDELVNLVSDDLVTVQITFPAQQNNPYSQSHSIKVQVPAHALQEGSGSNSVFKRIVKEARAHPQEEIENFLRREISAAFM